MGTPSPTPVTPPGQQTSDVTRAQSHYDRYSTLAGPMTEPHYYVEYRNLAAKHRRRFSTIFWSFMTIAMEAVFLYWLLQQSHRPSLTGGGTFQMIANVFVIGSIGLMELLRVVNAVSLSLASIVARDPIPVTPQPGLRVAYVTTIVPDKEPMETVRATLEAAKLIRYPDGIDIWLLDEGNDPRVIEMCRELGVNHFSRKGVERYNQVKGINKAKSKHGNYNAWLDAVATQRDRDGRCRYDIFLSADPDHVPQPNFAERMLGYFRDPDVAFVVGPQSYANGDNFVTKAAESQQFPFHSIIQRAGNFYGSPMMVGTNNAIRVEALFHIGGLVDSVTEDMATGLEFHVTRNPETGKKFKSVYTPDVVAIGEGPSSWGDYFSQQDRWSRGSFEVLLKSFWRQVFRLGPRRAFHYGLMLAFYPSMALGWILGGINALLYASMGVRGIIVPPELWLMLYVDATALQLTVYIRNRRYNTSPFESVRSPGVMGMLMSVLVSPIFVSSLIKTILRRPAKFVITPKGSSSTGDTLFTFRKHLQWCVWYGAVIGLSFAMGYAIPLASVWPVMAFVTSAIPLIIWLFSKRRSALSTQTEKAAAKGQYELAVDHKKVATAPENTLMPTLLARTNGG